MAQLTLDATNAQVARLQAARAVWNSQNGTSLSLVRFIYAMLGAAVETYLASEVDAAAQVVRDAIKADMIGGT